MDHQGARETWRSGFWGVCERTVVGGDIGDICEEMVVGEYWGYVFEEVMKVK